MSNNRTVETLYTFAEIRPWMEEYIKESHARMEQEKRVKQIVMKQQQRAVLRWKAENIIKGIALIAMPFLVAEISGVDDVLISLILTVPAAISYFSDAI